jgi:hypothetical protein
MLTLSAHTVNATVTAAAVKTTITDKIMQGITFPLTGGDLDVVTVTESRYIAGVYAVAGMFGGAWIRHKRAQSRRILGVF